MDQQSIVSIGQTLTSGTEKDHDVINEKVDSLNERMGNLTEGISSRVKTLEDAAAKVFEYADSLDHASGTLTKIEESLDALKSLGAAAKDAKHLDTVKVSGS